MKRVKDFNYISGKKYDGMMSRCYREKDSSFKTYGKRSIRVCSAWIKSIYEFRAWLRIELARLNITEHEFAENSGYWQLDRINPDVGYSPENCRIVDAQTNARNKHITKGRKIISLEGKEHVF